MAHQSAALQINAYIIWQHSTGYIFHFTLNIFGMVLPLIICVISAAISADIISRYYICCCRWYYLHILSAHKLSVCTQVAITDIHCTSPRKCNSTQRLNAIVHLASSWDPFEQTSSPKPRGYHHGLQVIGSQLGYFGSSYRTETFRGAQGGLPEHVGKKILGHLVHRNSRYGTLKVSFTVEFSQNLSRKNQGRPFGVTGAEGAAKLAGVTTRWWVKSVYFTAKWRDFMYWFHLITWW